MSWQEHVSSPTGVLGGLIRLVGLMEDVPGVKAIAFTEPVKGNYQPRTSYVNFKRKKPKSSRSGCLLCKPHKHQRAKDKEANKTLQERRADLKKKDS